MIAQIKQLIIDHPEWLRAKDAPISVMKVSTPTSGRDKNKGKVLLFIFEEGEALPTFCIKTVRTYAAGEVIRENYSNLKLLEEGVSGSEHSGMFAKPLYLYDDGVYIFSVETVCPGAKFSLEGNNTDLVIEKYIAWQSHLAKKTGGTKLLQHGDLTPDNVLVDGKKVYFTDYDYAGRSELPGFDLYNFISKSKLSADMQDFYYNKYFPRYFQSIGAKIRTYEDMFPLYYAEEVIRKNRKT